MFFKSMHIKGNFAKFPQTCPNFSKLDQENSKKSTSNIKKTSASVFGHHLFQIKAHQMISQRISHFVPQIS